MKSTYLFAIALLGLMFSACSRDEPVIAPVVVPPPVVVTPKINEVYSAGTTTNLDWVEIYNPSSTAMDLSNYKIFDVGGQSGSKPKKTLPAGTTVPAMGHLVIVVDDTTTSGFGLSSSGETIWLENAAGNIIDSVAFPAVGVDSSYGRKPDGSSTWQKLTPVTKGSTNGGTIILKPLVLNEIFARGVATDPDWIEIYNPNDIGVDMTGYKIYDLGGQSGTKPKKVFPAGTVIPAKGFFVIVTDIPVATDSSGFGLSSSGEDVWFENAAGTVIDQIKFLATTDATQSYGRVPDGVGAWVISSVITKGTSNKP